MTNRLNEADAVHEEGKAAAMAHLWLLPMTEADRELAIEFGASLYRQVRPHLLNHAGLTVSAVFAAALAYGEAVQANEI
ncbi:hypothetical protein [Humisphaera borealis]|uniref:Uncharacterized protein n=1 Tax=Humisphaera borealis TaxID=2807512 RepID=A0A7M2X099_9BACT|nr:hypothetical protein [Humisphaera borealis]QOV91079.1 hypothetical protein IPV69_06885 [Humisphaera borealis]